MNPLKIIGGCLAVLLVLAFLACGGLYYAVMHTSMPLAALKDAMEQDPRVHVQGLTGTVAAGFHADSIRFESLPGTTSEILDVRFAYTGPWDLLVNKRLIITDISVGKARLYAAEGRSKAAEEPSRRTVAHQEAGELKLFAIDRLHLADVLIENPRTGFKLSIPEITWTGFKARPGKVELGDWTVRSDRLDVDTRPGRTVRVDGRERTFEKFITATLKPTLHAGLRRPLAIHADLGLDEQQRLACRISSLNGCLVGFLGADRSGFLHAAGANPADFFDAPPYDLPRNLTLDAAIRPDSASKRPSVTLQRGSFVLGESKFALPPAEYGPSKQADGLTLAAIHHSPAGDITCTILLGCEGRVYRARLAGPADMRPEDVVARVFHGKSYAELDPPRREAVDRRVKVYCGSD